MDGSVMLETIEITFGDLKEEVQKKLLEFFGYTEKDDNDLIAIFHRSVKEEGENNG